MKVLVPVKRVVDYNVKVRVKSDGSGVDIANVKMSMNRKSADSNQSKQSIQSKQNGTERRILGR